MNVSKSELSVVLFLCTIAAAAASAYASHSVAAGALADAGLQAQFRTEAVFFKLTMACLLLALVAGAVWLLPMVRRQTHEHGKLESLTGLLRQRSRDFERAALTDPLTGMNNRRFFDESLRQSLTEFGQIESPVGLMLIDLDHFKAINDTHGHDVGDVVLKAVAACLFECTRFQDTVARVGGEEFAVVAPHMDLAELQRFADRIREAIAKVAIDIGDNVRLRVTTSIGLAVSEAGDESAAFLKRADIALYRAKQAGRNRVYVNPGDVIPFGTELNRPCSVSS